MVSFMVVDVKGLTPLELDQKMNELAQQGYKRTFQSNIEWYQGKGDSGIIAFELQRERMNEDEARAFLNIGYMVCYLERVGKIKGIDNDVLTNFMLASIDDFMEYDRRMDDIDFYENMDQYYYSKLIELGANNQK